ncbi:cadherin-related family member 4-like [Lepisosteus oculatus]|uniref:cadherin-related family member 4-like n=1 Tax=Lepisosteus oculatus TaxID=7918 RepID=UPI003717BA94
MLKAESLCNSVNNTLDYDNALVANNNFQYQATVWVNDSGIPSLTTAVPVLVTVTRVNEYTPQFQGPLAFSVPENAPRLAVIGAVKATDRDWEFSAMRYSIISGSGFSINPKNGELYLRRSLDFETQKVHLLKVQVVDLNQDVDPSNQRTANQEITIHVQNVNDNPPVCNPFVYESTIYSTLAAGIPIITLSCTDIDDDELTATITNGAVTDRFSMNGMSLSSKNTFSYNPEGLFDHTLFEVAIEVSDGKHSTKVLAVVRVIPWTTTTTTNPTTTETHSRAPLVVTSLQKYWDPDLWFVLVLTITGALALISLGLLMWKLLTWTSVCGRPLVMSEHLLNDKILNSADEIRTKEIAASVHGLQVDPVIKRFDGKAQDPVTGRHYLFNSQTGQRRWI